MIEIAGTLVHRGAWIGQSSGLTSYEGIAAQLQAALSDPAIRGIAFDIDSFGGEVAGAFDLADRIRHSDYSELERLEPSGVYVILTECTTTMSQACIRRTKSPLPT